MKEKVIFNWSSGKDSALCLHKMLHAQHYDILCLLTSINASFQRISMHGVRVALLERQAASIGLPLVKMEIPEMPSMEDYENVMSATLTELIAQGATASVFGDILLEDLRAYREKQLAALNLKALFPLWKIPTDTLVKEFIDLGYKSIITCVNDAVLDKSFVGRTIDYEFLNDLPENVDPCGENGEYHSFVYDGPIFRTPIDFKKGALVYKEYTSTQKDDDNPPPDNGFWYCDLLPERI